MRIGQIRLTKVEQEAGGEDEKPHQRAHQSGNEAEADAFRACAQRRNFPEDHGHAKNEREDWEHEVPLAAIVRNAKTRIVDR